MCATTNKAIETSPLIYQFVVIDRVLLMAWKQ